DIPAQNGCPTASRNSNCGRGLIDAQRRYAPPDEFCNQTPCATTQVDRRAMTQLQHGPVEFVVGVLAAQPTAHRQSPDRAIVVPNPTPFTVERTIVEIAQHVRFPPPWSRARTGC